MGPTPLFLRARVGWRSGSGREKGAWPPDPFGPCSTAAPVLSGSVGAASAPPPQPLRGPLPGASGAAGRKTTAAGNAPLRGSDARFDEPGWSGAGSARRRASGEERESWGGRRAAEGPSRAAAVPLGHPPPAPNKMRARSLAGGRTGPSTAMGILCPAVRPGPPPEREGPAASARLVVAGAATKPEEGLRMEARTATDTAGCCYCPARHR
ncbi:unnamed protein product [Urochloa humidicola]